MIRLRKILFVIADGGRARFVLRSGETGHYVTLEQSNAGKAPRGGAHAVAFRRFGAVRATTERRPDARERLEARFIEGVSEKAAALAASHNCEGVLLVAPPRLMPILRKALKGHAAILGELAKDLTKIPDHDLTEWLRPIELPASSL